VRQFCYVYEPLNSISAQRGTRQTGWEWKTTGMLSEMYLCTVIAISCTGIRNDCGICNSARFTYGTRGVKNTGCKAISFQVESIIFFLIFALIYLFQ